MSLFSDDRPFADDEEDLRRKAEIEEMMRRERERYFRDEPVQQEYRDILDRMADRQAEAESAARPPGPFDLKLAEFLQKRAGEGADAEAEARPKVRFASLSTPTGVTSPDGRAGVKAEPFTREAISQDELKVFGAKPAWQEQDRPAPVRVAQNQQPGQSVLSMSPGRPSTAPQTSASGAPSSWDVRQATRDYFDRRFKGTPLQGKWDLVEKAAQRNSISPSLLAAVLAQESGWGKDTKGSKNNPGGLMEGKDQTGFKSFVTIDDGIEATAYHLGRNFRLAGGDWEELGERYAPVKKKPKNDQQNLNQYWLPNVRTFNNEFEALRAPRPGIAVWRNGSPTEAYAAFTSRYQRNLRNSLFDNASTWNPTDTVRMRNMTDTERALRNVKKARRSPWPKLP